MKASFHFNSCQNTLESLHFASAFFSSPAKHCSPCTSLLPAHHFPVHCSFCTSPPPVPCSHLHLALLAHRSLHHPACTPLCLHITSPACMSLARKLFHLHITCRVLSLPFASIALCWGLPKGRLIPRALPSPLRLPLQFQGSPKLGCQSTGDTASCKARSSLALLQHLLVHGLEAVHAQRWALLSVEERFLIEFVDVWRLKSITNSSRGWRAHRRLPGHGGSSGQTVLCPQVHTVKAQQQFWGAKQSASIPPGPLHDLPESAETPRCVARSWK